MKTISKTLNPKVIDEHVEQLFAAEQNLPENINILNIKSLLENKLYVGAYIYGKILMPQIIPHRNIITGGFFTHTIDLNDCKFLITCNVFNEDLFPEPIGIVREVDVFSPQKIYIEYTKGKTGSYSQFELLSKFQIPVVVDEGKLHLSSGYFFIQELGFSYLTKKKIDYNTYMRDLVWKNKQWGPVEWTY